VNKLFPILLIFLMLGAATSAHAQWDEDPEDYSTEFIYGVNKNTAGGLIGGFYFKYSRKAAERQYQTFGIELMNVKSPLESRTGTFIGNSFIFGKLNYLYAIRLQYGRDLVLFKKASQQGVEIKAVSAIGPSIGVIAPYYIEYDRSPGQGFIISSRERYDPEIHSRGAILGPGRIFQGLGESELAMGLNLKLGLSFELGSMKSNVMGLEIGGLLDMYGRDIELMSGDPQPQSVFPTAYLSLFFGSRH